MLAYSKKPTQVCVRFTETTELKISVIGNQKILPGLKIEIHVIFRPTRGVHHQVADRRYELTCYGYESQTQYTIPIICESHSQPLSYSF